MSTRQRKIPKILLIVDESRIAGRNLVKGIARYAHNFGPWFFCRKLPYYCDENRVSLKNPFATNSGLEFV